LFVANEDSDTIVTFRVDQPTGMLTRVRNAVRIGSTVCIALADEG
jgi:6-phosphogluconolactonase (cycloisomerase 2 family)